MPSNPLPTWETKAQGYPQSSQKTGMEGLAGLTVDYLPAHH
jgi:hypothetical protein